MIPVVIPYGKTKIVTEQMAKPAFCKKCGETTKHIFVYESRKPQFLYTFGHAYLHKVEKICSVCNHKQHLKGNDFEEEKKNYKIPEMIDQEKVEKEPEPKGKPEDKAYILDKSGRFLRKYVCSKCGKEINSDKEKTCGYCGAWFEKKK